MTAPLSRRLADALDALPLRPGMRVIEVGRGPGALARAIAGRVAPGGHVLGIDRSAAAIRQAEAAAAGAAGGPEFRQAAVERFALAAGEAPYDLAVALRVGALDGRHPDLLPDALAAIAGALAPGGRLMVDGGDPLRELPLPARGARP